MLAATDTREQGTEQATETGGVKLRDGWTEGFSAGGEKKAKEGIEAWTYFTLETASGYTFTLKTTEFG